MYFLKKVTAYCLDILNVIYLVSYLLCNEWLFAALFNLAARLITLVFNSFHYSFSGPKLLN